MGHTRKPHILNEDRTAHHLVGNVQALSRLADDFVVLRRLGGRTVGRFAGERIVGGQLPIACLLGAILGEDEAIIGNQFRRRYIQLLGGKLQQDCAGLGGDRAKGRAADLDGIAAGGDTFVRRVGCIGWILT